MGFAVISKCSIEFPKGTPNSIFDKVCELLKADDDFYLLITDFPHMIYFEISGNKAINYDKVKEIQNKALELLEDWPVTKEGFRIQCDEFTEACDGYCFEFDEEKVCKNCQGRGWYLGDINPEISHEYGKIDCEECKDTGVKE